MSTYDTDEKNKKETEAEKLERFKKNIKEYFGFFDENIQNYKRWMSFAFKDTITADQKSASERMSRPKIQINYTEPFLARLLGEYSSMTPEPVVQGNDTGDRRNAMLTTLIEGHMADIFDRYNESERDQVVLEQCTGGFSVLKVLNDYLNDQTFDQMLGIYKCKDPTLCFFDPMDRSLNKQNSKRWGEIHPFDRRDFEEKYPQFKEYSDKLQYNDTPPMPWSYKNQQQDILLLAEYYNIEYVSKNLVELADNSVKLESDYNQLKKNWTELAPPPVVKRRRKVKQGIVKRYLFIGNKIIDEQIVDYPSCNYFFVPGKSAWIYSDSTSSQVEQVTCSYIKNAVDPQNMLNGMAQAIGAYSERIMAQKYIIEETTVSDPESWKNPNKPGNLLWRSNPDGQGEKPAPIPVQQQDLPQTIVVMYQSMMQTMQNALGVYDASLGIYDKDLSGIAIENAATQNNSVSMPFFRNYLCAINCASSFILKMFPKVYIAEMKLPLLDKEGNRHFPTINKTLPNGEKDPMSLQIQPSTFDLNTQVKVNAGQTFTLQKDKSLKTMIEMSQAFPRLGDIINRKGLSLVARQLDIRDKDKLEQLIKEEDEMQKNAPPQPNPMQVEIQLKQQEMMMKQQKDQMDAQIKIKQLQLDQEKLANEMRIAEIQLAQSTANDAIQHEKVMAEINSHRMDAAASLAEAELKHNDQLHRHTIDVMKMHDSRENEKAKRMINDFPIKTG